MKSNLFIAEQFCNHGLINIPQGINLWHLLNHVVWASVEGDVVEIGCHGGITAAMLGQTLVDLGSDKQLVLYDSFEGLSQPTAEDGNFPFIPENLQGNKRQVVKDRFGALEIPQPTIVPGWVSDTLPQSLPDRIAFAHLDLDVYHPTLVALEAVYPRLASGGIVVVDDYCDNELSPKVEAAYRDNLYNRSPYSGSGPQLPPRGYCIGNWVPAIKRACEKFLSDKSEEMTVMIAAEEKHAFFRKV